MESSETSCRDLSSSPPGPYGQEMYVFRSEERFKSPPILPPHLLQVILNKDTNISCDPALLPEPNHVMLNHLYALSIKDSVMVLSATHRYKKKYVTTLLYKPIWRRYHSLPPRILEKHLPCLWTELASSEPGRLFVLRLMCVSEPLVGALLCLWLQTRALWVHGVYFKKHKTIYMHMRGRLPEASWPSCPHSLCLWVVARAWLGSCGCRNGCTGSFFF